MNSKVKYLQENDKLLIKIKPSPKKIVFLGVFLFFVIPSSIFIFFIINTNELFNIDTIIAYAGSLIFFIVTWKYLKRLFEEEELVVTQEYLSLCKQFVFRRNYRKYLAKNIKGLRYVGVEPFTEHPLMPESFDYLGIGTGEKEVQFLAEGGNMLLVYNGGQVRFGKNLDEEDADDMLSKIRRFNPKLAG